MNTDFDCVVVANGQFPSKEEILGLLRNAPFIVACDGAGLSLFERGFHVDAIVGDLDSLPKEFQKQYSGCLHHSGEQITNDLTKTMRFVADRGFKKPLILGATGLREDHTLGNISLLTEYINLFDHVEMMSDFGVFIPLKRSATLKSVPGQQISIFSITPQTELTINGLRWEVEKRCFESWWQGTLNEAVGGEFTVSFEGDARVVVYKAFTE